MNNNNGGKNSNIYNSNVNNSYKTFAVTRMSKENPCM
jgi:hypothetical protein